MMVVVLGLAGPAASQCTDNSRGRHQRPFLQALSKGQAQHGAPALLAKTCNKQVVFKSEGSRGSPFFDNCKDLHFNKCPRFPRFAIVALEGVLDSSAPSAARLVVSLFLCSSRSNARGESRALEGRRFSSNSP